MLRSGAHPRGDFLLPTKEHETGRRTLSYWGRTLVQPRIPDTLPSLMGPTSFWSTVELAE